jgi:hypothetical protein
MLSMCPWTQALRYAFALLSFSFFFFFLPPDQLASCLSANSSAVPEQLVPQRCDHVMTSTSPILSLLDKQGENRLYVCIAVYLVHIHASGYHKLFRPDPRWVKRAPPGSASTTQRSTLLASPGLIWRDHSSHICIQKGKPHHVYSCCGTKQCACKPCLPTPPAAEAPRWMQQTTMLQLATLQAQQQRRWPVPHTAARPYNHGCLAGALLHTLD